MRLRDGLKRKKFEQLFGLPLDERIDIKEYEKLMEAGLLLDEKGRLRLSDEGFYLADEIALRLVK